MISLMTMEHDKLHPEKKYQAGTDLLDTPRLFEKQHPPKVSRFLETHQGSENHPKRKISLRVRLRPENYECKLLYRFANSAIASHKVSGLF